MNKQAYEQDARLLGEQLFEFLMDAPEGFNKEASTAGTQVLRRRIREDGLLPKILTPTPANDSMLTRFPNHENPVIVREREPDSPGAVSVPFGAGYDTMFYYADAYICEFFRVQTPELVKDINHLRPIRYNLVKWIQDNMLKDIQTQVDFFAWNVFDQVVGPVEGIGAAGYEQNHRIVGDITRQTYPLVESYLEDHELNNGIYVMNRKTAKKFRTNFDAVDYGDGLATETFKNGTAALNKNIGGVPHLFTIKRGLIPDNVIYIFTEENFLGNFDVLEDVKLHVKKEKDFIHMSACETLAVTIGNVAGIHRVEFTG